MLSDVQQHDWRRSTVQVRKDKRTGRFQIVKLEDRIAPRGNHGASGCDNGNKERSGKCG